MNSGDGRYGGPADEARADYEARHGLAHGSGSRPPEPGRAPRPEFRRGEFDRGPWSTPRLEAGQRPHLYRYAVDRPLISAELKLWIGIIALGLVPLCAVAWAANEAIVVWALESRIIPESATRSMPHTVRVASVVLGVFFAVLSLPVVAYAGSQMYGLGPVRFVVDPLIMLMAPLSRPLRSALTSLRAAGAAICALVVGLVKAALGSVGRATARLLGLAWTPFGFGLSLAKAVAHRALAGARSLVAAVARPGVGLLTAAGTVVVAIITLAFAAVWFGARFALSLAAAARQRAASGLAALKVWSLRALARARGLAALVARPGVALTTVAGTVVVAIITLAFVAVWFGARFVLSLAAGARQRAATGLGALRERMRSAALEFSAFVVRALEPAAGRIKRAAAAVWQGCCGACAAARRMIDSNASSMRLLAGRVLAGIASIVALAVYPFAVAASFTWRAATAGVSYFARDLSVASATVFAFLGQAFDIAARAVPQTASAAFSAFAKMARPPVRIAVAITVATAAAFSAMAAALAAAARALAFEAHQSYRAAVRLVLVSAWAILAAFYPAAAVVAGLGRWSAAALVGAGRAFDAFVGAYVQGLAGAARGAWAGLLFPLRVSSTGLGTVPDLWNAAGWVLEHGSWPRNRDYHLTGSRLASLGATGAALGCILLLASAALAPVFAPEPSVTVVHWSTGHLIRDGSDLRLLRQMAAEYNAAGHRTQSGKRIKIEIYYEGGAEQSTELISRLTRGAPIDKNLPDPALVTPSASHWLVNVNYAAGREVIDLRDTDSRSLARSYVGIVTYRDMAECLGWPQKEVGFADIIALRDDPRGWASYPCARPEWGPRALLAFTDPSTSDTGRAVLMALYAIGAGKAPEDLTVSDLTRPEVVDYVKSFQLLVDHYMSTSIALNTRIHLGPGYGHFFILPEDNLVHLYDGTEVWSHNGIEERAPPLQRDMVLIYPREGSQLRENCACLVRAPWVSAEQAEASDLWLSFLRQDAQQASFVASGFRPGTGAPIGQEAARPGMNQLPPTNVLHAERVDPAVATAIDGSWDVVKRPAIVTFVVDTSGSMLGNKLKKAKFGLTQAIEVMARNNQVGLVTFDEKVNLQLPVGQVTQNKATIEAAIRDLKAGGETALYDAIKAGILMTDEAEGDPNAIRAVVVITDGRANRGSTGLDDLVQMASDREIKVSRFRGFADDQAQEATTGRAVTKENVSGTALALKTRRPVQVFFIAIGKDADLDIGRILAGATGAEFQGVGEADLAEVLEQFSRYF